MSRYDLAIEKARVLRRPSEEPIRLLALLVVDPTTDAKLYAKRLREVVSSAVGISQTTDFERDDVATSALPEWFVAVSGGTGMTDVRDVTSLSGKDCYLEERGGEPWDVEEWVYCFDPDLRRWSWWDVTERPDGRVCVWVDTKGEAHIPCEELWWLVFVAGARSVEPLMLEDAGVWAEQGSIQ